MKKMIILVCLLAGVAAAEGRFLSLVAGFSVPLGDFSGQRQTGDVGSARVGFTGGFEYDHGLGLDGLAWSTAFHYLANDYENPLFTRGVTLDIYESGAYSTLSLLTGLKWQKNLSESTALFVVGHVGYASIGGPFLSGLPPDATATTPIVEFQMGRSGDFAYAFGFGFLFNEHTYLGLRYLNAGRAEFSKQITYQSGTARRQATVGWDTPVNMMMINVGYTIAFD